MPKRGVKSVQFIVTKTIKNYQLLHFSNTEGQEFIFHPSDKNYSKDIVDTDEIIELDGCMFY